MRWLLPLLLASIATLVVSLATSPAAPPEQWNPTAAPALRAAPAPRLFCERPRTLRLHRFEDRSARLECAGRVIARVAVPG